MHISQLCKHASAMELHSVTDFFLAFGVDVNNDDSKNTNRSLVFQEFIAQLGQDTAKGLAAFLTMLSSIGPIDKLNLRFTAIASG